MKSRTNPVIYVRNESGGFLSDEQVSSLVPAVQRQVTEHFEPVWGGKELRGRGRHRFDARKKINFVNPAELPESKVCGRRLSA